MSNLTSLQPLWTTSALITFELDDDGDVMPLTACINGEEVDCDEFGLEVTLQLAAGIKRELAQEVRLLNEDRAADRAMEYA